MSKREANAVAEPNSKRVKIPCPSFKYYQFNEPIDFKNVMFPDVVARENLFGCARMLSILENEILPSLREPEKYEFFSSTGKGLPVNRCLHFHGIPSSSKRTTLLSFAQQYQIPVLELSDPYGVAPEIHLSKLYALAKSYDQTVIVLLRNFASLLSKEFPLHPHFESEANKRNAMLYHLPEELEKVIRSKSKIWTVLISDRTPTLEYAVDKYFLFSTYWTCFPAGASTDFLTDVDRSMIIISRIKHHLPELNEFPFDEQTILEFCTVYAKFCTYRQLEGFVSGVITDLRLNNAEFTSTTLELYLKSRNMSSILVVAPIIGD